VRQHLGRVDQHLALLAAAADDRHLGDARQLEQGGPDHPVGGGAQLELLPAPDPEPENAALAGAARDELAAAMARLAPAHHEVLILTFAHGLSYQEMARVVGVPEGTIKSRLSNAKRALRALLEEEATR